MERIISNITAHYPAIIFILVFMTIWVLGIIGGIFVMFKHPELLLKLQIFKLTNLKTSREITKFDLYQLNETERFTNIDEKTKKVLCIIILAFGIPGFLLCLLGLALVILL